jgi:hypothetical protein
MRPGEPSRVRMLFDDGVCEEVAVSFAGECVCRLESTPMASTTEARLGDVVEFEPRDGVARMTRVVERSPYETLTWVAVERLATSDAFARLIVSVEEKGGRVERAFGGTVLVHVRPDEADDAAAAFASLLENHA